MYFVECQHWSRVSWADNPAAAQVSRKKFDIEFPVDVGFCDCRQYSAIASATAVSNFLNMLMKLF
jgi:hypothetical protein